MDAPDASNKRSGQTQDPEHQQIEDASAGDLPRPCSSSHSPSNGTTLRDRRYPHPEGLIADRSLAKAIRDQALLLPPIYQKVLDLYYFQGKRLGEIAQICHRSEEEVARIHAQCALAVQLAMKHYRPR